MDITQVVQSQKSYFEANPMSSVEQRITMLKTLKMGIKSREKALMTALKADLGKPELEAYTTEIGFLYRSIDHTIKNLRQWAKTKKVKADLAQLPGRAQVKPTPYGTVLIIGPFNYPIQLLLEPLVGAIAGGNTAVLKPSERTPTVSKEIVEMIDELFEATLVVAVEGDATITKQLLNQPFDYIFFTGSERVGKIVMEKAAQTLTPITLELGGKSPVIVDETANLDVAAKRIVWGKFINTGQTCVAPDYVLVHDSVYDAFLVKVKQTITDFYGSNPQQSEDFGRVVTVEDANRLANLLQGTVSTVYCGGEALPEARYIAPTIFKDVHIDDALMEEEIFGPLLPTMSYTSLADIDQYLAKHPKPLAFYVFSENIKAASQLMTKYAFGGGCINDTITHVASTHLPFGGVGKSGIGRYHGEASFKTFTYEKAIVIRSTKINLPLVFPPYTGKLKWMKKLMK